MIKIRRISITDNIINNDVNNGNFKGMTSKVLSIYCKSSLEVAPGKYLNRALPLCKHLFILYLICQLKFTMLSPNITTSFSLGIIVELGLFCLYKGMPGVCLVVRSSSVLM